MSAEYEKLKHDFAQSIAGDWGCACVSCQKLALATAATLIAHPMVGVLASNQHAPTVGELQVFKKGWRKLADKGEE